MEPVGSGTAAPSVHRARLIWQTLMAVLGGLALFAIFATIAGLLMERQLKAYAALTAAGYLLSALGFLCLAGWAYAKGHFEDVERIKDKVLEAEGPPWMAEQP